MKKILLSFVLSVMGLCMASADEPVRGILATYEGSEVSYKLSDMPTVRYETQDGVQYAVLYLRDVEEPVLSVALAEGKQLIVAYGEYIPNPPVDVPAVSASISERNGHKLIQGGRLIIVGKDGRKYDAAGVEL